MPFVCPSEVLCMFLAAPLAITGQSQPISSPDDSMTALRRHCLQNPFPGNTAEPACNRSIHRAREKKSSQDWRLLGEQLQ